MTAFPSHLLTDTRSPREIREAREHWQDRLDEIAADIRNNPDVFTDDDSTDRYIGMTKETEE